MSGRDWTKPRTVKEIKEFLSKPNFTDESVVYATLNGLGEFHLNVDQGGLQFPFWLPMPKDTL